LKFFLSRFEMEIEDEFELIKPWREEDKDEKNNDDSLPTLKEKEKDEKEQMK